MRNENFYFPNQSLLNMKHLQKFNWLLALLFICANAQPAVAQIPENEDFTWFGIDFTQAKFIGSATQFKEAGEITNNDFRDKYILSWNKLFIDEPKKYNVADAVRRTHVNYLIEVTEKVNNGIRKNFFSNDPNDYGTLTAEKVSKLVKEYDFMGKSGVGLMFFVDGMSKIKSEASAWITFIDVKSKKVLLTAHKTGKSGGFGFRNYWAKSFDNILSEVKSEVKKSKG